MSGKSEGFNSLEKFIRRCKREFRQQLLVLARWSHNGGLYDHVLFEEYAEFEKFVRALPVRTNLLAFPLIQPDALVPEASFEILRSLVHQSIEGEPYLMLPVRNSEYSTDPLTFPRSYNPVYEASDYASEDPSIQGEGELVGRKVAFYRREPTWRSNHDYIEIVIGFFAGAY